MTLIVALRGSDGIVLAADSRGTYGDPRGVTAQKNSMMKLHKLARHVGVLLSGDAGLGNQLLASWNGDRNASESAPELMERFRAHVRVTFGSWFPGFATQAVQGSPIPVRPDLRLLIAGFEYDGDGNPSEAVLYNLLSFYDFAPVRLDHGFALDGVGQYALYLFNRLYREGYGSERLKHLAAYAITETASQDGKVGGPVRMATISPVDGYLPVTDEEVASILQQNTRRSDGLRKSFFGEETKRHDRRRSRKK